MRMDARFDIQVDPVTSLVTIDLAGFFTIEALDRFVAARALAYRQLRCGPNQHLSLTDVREMKIQSQEIVAAFGNILADPTCASRRLAFVVASSLARMQLQRAIGERDARCFTDRDEAERWVLSGGPVARAA